ncbi:MAG: SUMF1/EgtB/PvdO family nonheme iron enzyme [Treponema sp.]|nr:SUMF1/EgtB/PvdO family nonheme iron enzyme [Treponema sp.]
MGTGGGTSGSISYATTTVSKTTADAAFTNTLTKTGDGTVSYASSKTDVATVNATTGQVTIVGAGESTITATVTDSDTYTYATKTASYTLTVTATDTTPEGFVKVSGTTITGSETWTPTSDVFVSGRSLTIPDLYVCDHEVTQAEYEKYCKYGSSSPSSTFGAGDNYPAYYVSWYDAIVYCNLRSMDEGLTPAYAISGETDPTKWSGIAGSETDKYCGPSSSDSTWNGMTFDNTADGYRLPTEAEWEYIAREGKTSGTTYSGSNTIGEVAWYRENSYDKGSSAPDYGTHEVKRDKVSGTDSANALGIYDMSGNVWEWCWDWYSSSISSSTDAAGAASGSGRVGRGGSWINDADVCTVSGRDYCYPNFRNYGLGFRVVRSSSN